MVSRYVDRLTHLSGWLSPDEKVRAQRFLKEGDRRRFILGRAVVRYLCGMHLGLEPARIRLDRTPAGKPYLVNPIPANGKRFEFNIAHSGDCVLVAWAEGRAVGIDVEVLGGRSSALLNEVSASALSRVERAVLSAAEPNEAFITFYRIWVRNEAVLKGEGCGLGGSLQSFSVARRQVARMEWLEEVHFCRKRARVEGGRT